MPDNQDAKQMAIKAALVQMTAMQGWSYVKQLANNLVQREVVNALEEEDATKRDGKVLKASALRKGFADWFSAIESCKSFNPEPNDELSALELE